MIEPSVRLPLAQWLDLIQQRHPTEIELGLDRTRAVALRLGVMPAPARVITVAGTNGKGTTTALVESGLRLAGSTTGLYQSPHIVRFNERIRINGAEVTDDELVVAFEAVDAAAGKTSLTYFEFTTLAAAWLFAQAQLDYWVLEVGMGGRLDAVNVWDAEVAAVTSIDLDHQQWLGNTRSAIGLEKIAVGRGGKPLIVGDRDLPAPVRAYATEQCLQMIELGCDFDYVGPQLDQLRLYGANNSIRLPAHGWHPDNVAVALQILSCLSCLPAPASILSWITAVNLPGRHQCVGTQPQVVLDVGHNPQAARWLAQRFAAASGRVFCLVGMLADKAVEQTLAALVPVVDGWYPVQLDVPRALKGTEIAVVLGELDAKVLTSGEMSPKVVLSDVLAGLNPEDTLIVFGSFYTVAAVMATDLI